MFTSEQAERLANAFATYYTELRTELVTREYLDARLAQLEARVEARIAQFESKFEAHIVQLESKSEARAAQLESKFDTRFAQLESAFESRTAQIQNRILASQVALFVLLGAAILLK